MTVDRVTRRFRHIKGAIRRYPLRNSEAFNFVVENAPAGSVTISLARDIHGKSYRNVRRPLELPDPKWPF